ncbi:MAG: hypothetical protein JWO46_3344 [Nocardioidaceae bacterium]|nr:hypothetical protein [Nocardioidaceae bacterium]
MTRPATVRFYFDADILGLAKVITGLRPDVTYPGDPGGTVNKQFRPPCSIPRDTKDRIWLPLVTAHGWLVISRDLRIRDNPNERRVVRETGARMVALSGMDAPNKWGQLELLMSRWRKIEELLDEPGPFIYLASRSGLRRLDLDESANRTPRHRR